MENRPFTSTHLKLHITPKDDQVTTLYTPWITPSVTIARNSSVHTHIHLYMLTVRWSKVEILSILKLPWDAERLGRWATSSQVCKQTTGTFYQLRITACSVTEV